MLALLKKNLTLILLFLGITFGILFLNHFPHYYGLTNTPKGYFYSGQVSWFDPWDINNYFSAIRWGQLKKSLLLENFNTTQPVKTALIYPLYTLTGILFPKTNPIILYYSLAIFNVVALSVVIYYLSLFFLKNKTSALLALILISLGGGLGWLFSNPEASADTSIPGLTFLMSFQKPHEGISIILYLLSLTFSFLAFREKKLVYALISLFSLLLLIPIYPYRLLSFFLILGVYWLFNQKAKNKIHSIKLMILFSVITVPLGLFYVLHFQSSGFATLTAYQPRSISIFSLVLGYATFLPIFLYQLPKFRRSEETIFLNIWFIISLLLSFMPLGMGRLFLSGGFFPLVILNFLAIKDFSVRFRVKYGFLLFLLLLFGLATNFSIFIKRLEMTQNLSPWVYLPEEIKEGLGFLSNQNQDGVLASYVLSSYVPYQSAKKVYFGHRHQTPGFNEKIQKAELFYSQKYTSAEAKNFISENNLNFIILTKENGPGLEKYDFLKNVYENKALIIFSTDYSR